MSAIRQITASQPTSANVPRAIVLSNQYSQRRRNPLMPPAWPEVDLEARTKAQVEATFSAASEGAGRACPVTPGRGWARRGGAGRLGPAAVLPPAWQPLTPACPTAFNRAY